MTVIATPGLIEDMENRKLKASEHYGGRTRETLGAILESCCSYYGVHPDQVKSRSRRGEIVKARHMYCYVSRRVLKNLVSLSQIGSFIQRDHSSVLHAKAKIENHIYIGDRDLEQSAIELINAGKIIKSKCFDRDLRNSHVGGVNDPNNISDFFRGVAKKHSELLQEIETLVTEDRGLQGYRRVIVQRTMIDLRRNLELLTP